MYGQQQHHQSSISFPQLDLANAIASLQQQLAPTANNNATLNANVAAAIAALGLPSVSSHQHVIAALSAAAANSGLFSAPSLLSTLRNMIAIQQQQAATAAAAAALSPLAAQGLAGLTTLSSLPPHLQALIAALKGNSLANGTSTPSSTTLGQLSQLAQLSNLLSNPLVAAAATATMSSPASSSSHSSVEHAAARVLQNAIAAASVATGTNGTISSTAAELQVVAAQHAQLQASLLAARKQQLQQLIQLTSPRGAVSIPSSLTAHQSIHAATAVSTGSIAPSNGNGYMASPLPPLRGSPLANDHNYGGGGVGSVTAQRPGAPAPLHASTITNGGEASSPPSSSSSVRPTSSSSSISDGNGTINGVASPSPSSIVAVINSSKSSVEGMSPRSQYDTVDGVPSPAQIHHQGVIPPPPFSLLSLNTADNRRMAAAAAGTASSSFSSTSTLKSEVSTIPSLSSSEVVSVASSSDNDGHINGDVIGNGNSNGHGNSGVGAMSISDVGVSAPISTIGTSQIGFGDRMAASMSIILSGAQCQSQQAASTVGGRGGNGSMNIEATAALLAKLNPREAFLQLALLQQQNTRSMQQLASLASDSGHNGGATRVLLAAQHAAATAASRSVSSVASSTPSMTATLAAVTARSGIHGVGMVPFAYQASPTSITSSLSLPSEISPLSSRPIQGHHGTPANDHNGSSHEYGALLHAPLSPMEPYGSPLPSGSGVGHHSRIRATDLFNNHAPQSPFDCDHRSSGPLSSPTIGCNTNTSGNNMSLSLDLSNRMMTLSPSPTTQPADSPSNVALMSLPREHHGHAHGGHGNMVTSVGRVGDLFGLGDGDFDEY
jgi:hypothetical protein